jgi:hypothetical protein
MDVHNTTLCEHTDSGTLGAALTGKDTEPWEILYFKAYKSQLPVIEQALETAALMLGSDKSRSYCLEAVAQLSFDSIESIT